MLIRCCGGGSMANRIPRCIGAIDGCWVHRRGCIRCAFRSIEGNWLLVHCCCRGLALTSDRWHCCLVLGAEIPSPTWHCMWRATPIGKVVDRLICSSVALVLLSRLGMLKMWLSPSIAEACEWESCMYQRQQRRHCTGRATI
jgi:hypothetical protein